MRCRAVNKQNLRCLENSIWKGFCDYHSRVDPKTKKPQRKTFHLQSRPLDLEAIKNFFLSAGYPCEVINLDPLGKFEPADYLVVRGGLRHFTSAKTLWNNPTEIENIKINLKDCLLTELKEVTEKEATIRIHLGTPERISIRWFREVETPLIVEIYHGDISFLFPPKNSQLVIKSVE